MGMFDYIRCKYPLPVQGANALEYQTKDTPRQWCDLYEIREDGTLWFRDYDTEDRSELALWKRANPGAEPPDELKNNPSKAFMGSMASVNHRWIHESGFNGELRFYAFPIEPTPGWIEWSAEFEAGRTRQIILVEHQIVWQFHPKTFPRSNGSPANNPNVCAGNLGPTQGGDSLWTLPYPPSANNYWRSIVINGRGRVVVSREAKEFKKAVSLALAGISPIDGPVALTATFYRPRKRGDLDNGIKVLADSLKGILYNDDDQIVEIHAYRKDDKTDPRVELSVQQV